MDTKRAMLVTLGIALASFVAGCNKRNSPSTAANPSDTYSKLHESLVKRGMPDFGEVENPAGAASALWSHLMLPPDRSTTRIDNQFEGFQAEFREIKPNTFRVVQHESGTAVFNGRKLSAGIVKAKVDTIDREKGAYGTGCVIYANVRDREFEVDRMFAVMDCKENGAETLKAWRETTGFVKDPQSPIVAVDLPIKPEVTAAAVPLEMPAASEFQYSPSVSTLRGVPGDRAFLDESGAERHLPVLVLAQPIHLAAGAGAEQPEIAGIDVIVLASKDPEFQEAFAKARAEKSAITVKGAIKGASNTFHPPVVMVLNPEVVRPSGNSPAAPVPVPEESRFSRRSIREVVGVNISLVGTDVGSGKTIKIEISKSGWMQVGDLPPMKLDTFNSMNSECIGFEKQISGYLPPQRSVICNAIRDFSDTSMLHDVNSKVPVELREGDFYFIEGRSDIGYRYFTLK